MSEPDSCGRFSFSEVPASEHLLRFGLASGGRFDVRVSLKDNDSLRLHVKVPRGSSDPHRIRLAREAELTGGARTCESR